MLPFVNNTFSSGTASKTCDSQPEDQPLPPTPPLRRSTRVAAAEAKEKMTLGEEISSKINYLLFLQSSPGFFLGSFLLLFYTVITVAAILDQVAVLAQFATVGWEGFNRPPPTAQDVYNAIEGMDPSYKTQLLVSFMK